VAVLLAAGAGMLGVAVAGTDGRADRAPAPPARDGAAVWAAQGCGSCHALAAANATGDVAPHLDRALRGMPAAAIRTSIVAPGAEASPGWTPGAMPEDYASRMRPEELARLVGFLDRAVP
jgi:mono/diheme cytochrome c family protein